MSAAPSFGQNLPTFCKVVRLEIVKSLVTEASVSAFGSEQLAMCFVRVWACELFCAWRGLGSQWREMEEDSISVLEEDCPPSCAVKGLELVLVV